MDCIHTVTQSRDGEPGKSYCLDCGALAMQVHDRPCGECIHFKEVLGRGLCSKNSMGVTASMRVTYHVNPTRNWQTGLCFVAPPPEPPR